MLTPEASHERANRITIEAIRIARRDGQTPAERARIYEREIDRLTAEAEEPACCEPCARARAARCSA
jgi:hypothetical protein